MPDKPDLSRVKLVDPADFKGNPAVEEEERRKKEADAAHPLRRLPEHLQEKVEDTLSAIEPEYNEDGLKEGLTKKEARAVLTAALEILDTEDSPEFAKEEDQAQAERQAAEKKAAYENHGTRRPNPDGPRVMDTMSHLAIGKAMTEAMERGNWDEVKAALEAPVNTAAPAPGSTDPASWTKEERAAKVAEQVAIIEAGQAQTNDRSNAKDGGKSR